MRENPVIINTESETRVFYGIMTLVLLVMTVFVIATQPDLRQPERLIPFILIMTAHIILHWLLKYFYMIPQRALGYMLIQGTLMTALIFLTQHFGIVLGLSLALVGETIGVYGVSRRGVLAAAFYLALSLGFFVVVSGISQFGWWLVYIIPMIVFVVIYVEMYSRQASANKRASELLAELESANRELSEYAAQVEDLTITDERQRMARELHDTLSQGLAGLILQLEAADANLSSGRVEKARQIVQQTMVHARNTLANARRAIDDLRESNTLDFTEIIQREVSRFRSTAGIPCILEVNLPQDLPERLVDPLVRIMTEALANIIHHAGATQASIVINVQDQKINLEIQDNGVGFEPSDIETGHYGLIGMRERARLAGGELSIDSQPGHGTTIRSRIPIS